MNSQTIISPHTASLKSLHIFCSAAKELSFKKAADQLFITPSAVSHQITGETSGATYPPPAPSSTR